MVEFGINRLKYASEVIIALLSELKESSTAGKCNTLVALDGFNALYCTKTKIFGDQKAMILPDKVSLTKAFLDITKPDWCNGSIVLTVDTSAVMVLRVQTSFFLLF